MNTRWLGVSALMISASLLGACSSSRDVQVEGSVSAASSEAQGKVLLQFYDVLDEEVTPAGEMTLEAPGAFEHELALEGDQLRIFAVQDTNGDGTCSEGEAWATLNFDIDDDDHVSGAALNLTNQPCPEQQ